MKVIFHISSSNEHNSALADFARKWSAPFYQYCMTCIHESIARWGGVYNPFSGVTSNQAEGFNYVLKHLQEWKEAPLHCMVLSLYYL